jgi:ferredoxin-nitrite reductase
LNYVGVPVPCGRWSGEQMLAVADLAQRYSEPGLADIRLSQKQNAILLNIPKANVEELCRQLGSIKLSPHAPHWRHLLVSCTGSQFCNLAVVETKQRADDILQYLESEVGLDSPIRVAVTGCPNSCAQVQVADISLSGTKTSYNGEKVDAFDLLVGGALGENPRFARRIIQKIPGVRVKEVVAQLTRGYLKHRNLYPDGEDESFGDFVSRNDDATLVGYSSIEGWTPPAPRGGGEEEK